MKKNRLVTAGTAIVFAAMLVISNARYLHRFYVEYNRQPEIYNAYYDDLVEACEWLRPVFYNENISAVLISASDMPMAYVVTLVCLNYDPNRWFLDERAYLTSHEYDYYTNYGRMYFTFSQDAPGQILNTLPQLNLSGDMIFIVRPGELPLENPVHVIRNPAGQTALAIYRVKQAQPATDYIP